MPDHGYWVADRDRMLHDHATPAHVSSTAQTRSGTRPFFGQEADVLRRRGQSVAEQYRRVACVEDESGWPAMRGTDLRRPGSFM